MSSSWTQRVNAPKHETTQAVYHATQRNQHVHQYNALSSIDAETVVLAAGGEGVYNDVTHVILTNPHASTGTVVDIRDSTDGTIRLTAVVAATTTVFIKLPWPFPQSVANSPWTVDTTPYITTMYVTMVSDQEYIHTNYNAFLHVQGGASLYTDTKGVTWVADGQYLTEEDTETPTSIVETIDAIDAFLDGPTVVGDLVDYTNASNDYMEWTVTRTSPQTVSFVVQYFNGSGNRDLTLTVNSVVVADPYSFPFSGGWQVQASTTPINIDLIAGDNKIRLTARASSGGNIRSMTLTTSFSDIALNYENLSINERGYAQFDTLYTALRQDSGAPDKTLTYTLPIRGNGAYRIEFLCCNLYEQSADAHVYSISLDGTTLFSAVDMFAESGYLKPYVKSANFIIDDGSTTIEVVFTATTGNYVQMSAMRVLKQQ